MAVSSAAGSRSTTACWRFAARTCADPRIAYSATVVEHGVRSTSFGEGSVQGSNGRQTWVGGAAFQQDRHTLRELPQFDYRFSSPSIFMQDEIALTDKWALAISARADVHSEYGVLATPRISVLSRPAPGWTVRVAAGTGAFAPTPFTEETEETGLSRLRPLRGLRAERARNTSLDVTRVFGSIELTGTVFGSVVLQPIVTRTLENGDWSFSMPRKTPTLPERSCCCGTVVKSSSRSPRTPGPDRPSSTPMNRCAVSCR